MSVIFFAAVTGIGHLAYSVASAAERLPSAGEEFELSQDGETVWSGDEAYTFVGFGKGTLRLACPGGIRMAVGRKIGRLRGEPERKVRRLRARSGEYIMVSAPADTAEIFRRVS